MLSRPLLGATVALLLTACGRGSTDDSGDCADTGCMERVNIGLYYAWTPGAYAFTVTYGSTTETCTATLPGGADLTCTDGMTLRLEGAGFDMLQLYVVPERFDVVLVTLDGNPIHDAAVEPSYERAGRCRPCMHGVASLMM